MDRLNGSARLMIVTDLDQTMVDHQDPKNLSLLRFNALWESHYRHDSLLVFSSGRSPASYNKLRKHKPILTPDIVISSVGTVITYGDSLIPDDGWQQLVNQKWDRNIVSEEAARFPELNYKPDPEQQPYKATFYVDKDKALNIMKALSERLEKCGLDVKFVYSRGTWLDIVPQGAGKGRALAYLLKKLEANGKLPTNTLVCGDSGNDTEMFSIPQVYGVMVSNAFGELLQWHAENAKNYPNIMHASERCASGIIQAIGTFGLGLNTSPRDIKDLSMSNEESFNPGYEFVKFYFFYEIWRAALVVYSDDFIDNLKSYCHPSGIIVKPCGVDQLLHECLDEVRRSYGDMEGKPFWVWCDRLSFQQIGITLQIKFDRWEYCDGELRGCRTTAILSRKSDEPDNIKLLHIHETWLKVPGANDQTPWLL